MLNSIWNIVSGLSWYTIVLVSMLTNINIVIQNVFLFLLEGKSYTDIVNNFKTHGLDTWDTTAMFILLYSGSVIAPAYLFFFKDSGPKISKFASVYCVKLQKLLVSGDLLHKVHMLDNIIFHSVFLQ